MKARTERLLWCVAVVGLLSAGMAARAATPEPMPTRAGIPPFDAGIVVPAESLGARVLRVVANDPFRLSRAPSPVPFGVASFVAEAPPAAISLPPLQLRGVVGPPWRAVIEGVAGAEAGRLVHAGDTIGGARVVAVRPDAVTLRMTDTTWTLTMRRP